MRVKLVAINAALPPNAATWPGIALTTADVFWRRELIRERTGEGRKRALANGVKFGRKRKLSDYQRSEAIKRRDAGETLTTIAKSYGVDLSMISRLSSCDEDGLEKHAMAFDRTAGGHRFAFGDDVCVRSKN